MRKRIVSIICALPAIAAIALGESNQERGQRAMTDALAALGGDRFLAMQDRIESGRAYSFYRENLSGLSIAKIYTRYLTRPEPPVPGFFGIREREAFNKKEDNSIVFNENDAFELTFRGARSIPADQYARFRESTLRNIFYILRQRMGEPGLIFESRGTDVIDNQPVEIVDITDSENRVVTVHFQTSTKLPVRQITSRRDPKTNVKIEEVTRFTKFRDVGGGVMWPFVIQRERDKEKLFEIYSDSVTINQSLTDDLFTIPANVKLLDKPKPAAPKQ